MFFFYQNKQKDVMRVSIQFNNSKSFFKDNFLHFVEFDTKKN